MMTKTKTTKLSILREKMRDCKSFARLLKFKGTPFEPYSYQDELFEVDITNPDTKVCLQKSRQLGLSLACSILLLHAAINTPFSEYLILSRTHQQSAVVYKYVQDFISYNKWLRPFIDKSESRVSRIVFKNGSSITAQSCGGEGGQADNLRGLHVDTCVLYDESCYISDNALMAVLAMTHNASQVFISTPRFKRGLFYEYCTDDKHGYQVIKCNAYDCPHISAQKINEWKKAYSHTKWLNEVLGEFAQGVDSVFDQASVESAIDKSLPVFVDGCTFVGEADKNYIYSLDISSQGHDPWVLTIGSYCQEDNRLDVSAYHCWQSAEHVDEGRNATFITSPEQVITDIRRYARTFHPIKFYCDVTSDTYFAKHLLNQYLLPVEEIHWTQQSKERMIEHLATVFRSGKLGLPDDEDMKNELLCYSYDLKRMEDGADKRIYLKGIQDDYVDSLAMLAQSITDEQFEKVDYFFSM